MLRARIFPLKHPLRTSRIPRSGQTQVIALRPSLLLPSSATRQASTIVADDVDIESKSERERQTASFYISNVFPVRLASWDPRPALAAAREEYLLERLHDIGNDVKGHGFRVESFEIARKDGGVFMHFSYIPPPPSKADTEPDKELSPISALPEASSPTAASPGKLFLPLLMDSAKHHGGFPNWLGGFGSWWIDFADRKSPGGIPGHSVYWNSVKDQTVQVTVGGESGEGGTLVKRSGAGITNFAAIAGEGRVWVVKGRQWTEDMNRYPSSHLRVEFDGPDVSQEMLYTLFRPYGRLKDIVAPSPVPAGNLRFATVSYFRVSPAATAINTLHGYSTPTNTADFTLRASGQPSPSPVTLSRLRLYHQPQLKAHAIREWISGHPRIALPVIAFLIGTLSYTFFDPIRAFFVRAKVEDVWDLEQYSAIKYLRQTVLPKSFSLFRSSSSDSDDAEAGENLGRNAWSDRVEAEKSVEDWLSEYPSTFITITGPSGSGKTSLLSRVLKKQNKPSLVIDCAEISRSKNDAALVSSLADQTGYYPVFSFLSSLNGLIDLASVGLIGQKAGFSTPIEQQLRSILDVVGGALKDVSTKSQERHKETVKTQEDAVRIAEEHERRRQLIIRGGWHDGRIDCVAGNGVMSELGFGEEMMTELDMSPPSPPVIADIAPIAGEGVPPTSASMTMAVDGTQKTDSASQQKIQAAAAADMDAETEFIKSLPIVVLKNFAEKTAKGDLWNVMAEWGASLVENRIAHVIVITEGATATKALTKALPSKPLNSVGLADADQNNSLSYVKEKLGSFKTQNQFLPEDVEQINKLGGRMVDLENLVYKVRTGSTIKEAVDDIVLRNVVELRKSAFGDDAEDAKNLPWTRAQSWKVVSELAQKGELPYALLLQEFPFKGAEQNLKALEEHDLVSVTYVDGRASRLRPGKPVFRYAFRELVNDDIFRASCQLEYNAAVIAKAENEIKAIETELTTLKEITTDGGDAALGATNTSWLGLSKSSAIKERAQWLFGKMGKNVEKLEKLEEENEVQLKILSSGRA